MKAILLLTLALGAQLASADVLLGCDGLKNNIFDGIRQIQIIGTSIVVRDETANGADKGYDGAYFERTTGGVVYNLWYGIQVTIPPDLFDGKVTRGTVQFSTYDYPYETSVCGRIN